MHPLNPYDSGPASSYCALLPNYASQGPDEEPDSVRNVGSFS